MKAVFDMRGVMLDLGRITEKKSYYVSLLPWLAEWGYNMVHLHLVDDQRCALVFPSRPELATAGAFTADEMRNFIKIAKSHGISVMPEIEALGHSQFITENRKYRHLAEILKNKTGFNSMCPADPEVREILSDLLRDTADIFDHKLIHVGLDEVLFGDCKRCANKFRKAEEWKRFAEHAAWVHAEVRKLGRRPAMWADHVVKKLDMLDYFKKDVLMFNWDYTTEYRVLRAQSLLDRGFEVVACPSSFCWTTRVLPNAAITLKNLRNTSARSIPQIRQGVIGMVNTIWCPWRYLPGALDYAMAFGVHLMQVKEEDPRFAEKFVKRFYGIKAPGAVADAMRTMFDLSPDHNMYPRVVYGVDPMGSSFSREDRRDCELLSSRIGEQLAVLKKVQKSVVRNRDRYDDFVLSVEALLAMAQFGAAGRKKAAVKGAKTLYRRAESAWNRDRYPGDDLRFGCGHHGKDALLQALASYC